VVVVVVGSLFFLPFLVLVLVVLFVVFFSTFISSLFSGAAGVIVLVELDDEVVVP
jgi:hypothetical protein